MPRKAAEWWLKMDEYEEIPTDLEAGTPEYWKARARQWQKRCMRAEREKDALLQRIAELKAATKPTKDVSFRAERAAAIRAGDIYPGMSAPPRRL